MIDAQRLVARHWSRAVLLGVCMLLVTTAAVAQQVVAAHDMNLRQDSSTQRSRIRVVRLGDTEATTEAPAR